MMLRRELGRIRTRLLVVNLLVLLVPIAGLEFARLYERQLLNALERDMRNQAVLVCEMVEQDLGEGESIAHQPSERVVTRAARQTRTRVRLLDAAGQVVVDSHRDGPPEGKEPRAPRVIPNDFLDIGDGTGTRSRWEGDRWADVPDRREVRSALAGEPDAYSRVRDRSPSVLLFLTEPIRNDGEVVGVVYVTRSTQPVLVELYRIRRGLIQVLAIALGFTVLVTVLLALSISRPLSRLVRAARRIAAGERDVPVPVHGSGEVRELSEAFQTMTVKLDERLRYITELSADVAHEFKSPLTSIRGAAELLDEGAIGEPAARARFLQNILLDADRLDRLVSRLLELSRIEASSEPMADVNVAEVINNVVKRTDSPEQPVVVRGVDGALRIRGRALDLERALLNLVENALRFSPVDEPVTIDVVATKDDVALHVIDRGPGVSEAHRQRVFERFFTTDAERSGTGLGLAIVRSVAHGHGGTVRLADTDEGATFVLTLPQRLAPAT